MKLTTTTSKSIVRGVLIAASLAFTVSTAMAAATHAHKTAAVTHHVVHARRAAAAKRGRVAWRQPAPVQFFGGLFGLPFAVTTYAAPKLAAHAARSSGDGTYVFDTPPPDTSVSDTTTGWAAEQSAQEAAAQAEQQEVQSLNDLDASIAATEAQNDAANAATQQYLINNGM